MSLTVYKHLQDLYPDTLQCPCSNVTVSYASCVSLSFTLHQVCSSDFVSDAWISTLTLIQSDKWHGMNTRHFFLLSNMCRTIQTMINETVRRLNVRSFVTLNVPTEPKFKAEVNATLNQLIQDLTINFDLFFGSSHLWTQVDEPFVLGLYETGVHSGDSKFIVTTTQNDAQQMPQVDCNLRDILFLPLP